MNSDIATVEAIKMAEIFIKKGDEWIV
jgi:hypothetical protein